MATPRASCLLKVKSHVPEKVQDYLRHVHLNEFRFKWPSEFIFFCGGRSDIDPRSAVSLRHYLLAERKIEPKLQARVVLAEAANQIYRDTTYKDLITYEEDIAKISRIVLLIAESAGSLAELGAFSSTPHLKEKLCVIMQEEYYNAESFVRYGPIKRLENEDRSRLAFFPWRVTDEGQIIKRSVQAHVSEITKFINDRLSAGAKTFSFGAEASADLRDFAVVLWLAHLAQAITIDRIVDYAKILGHPISRDRARNCFYCMKLAGWMDDLPYSGSTYYITTSKNDVTDRYSFFPDSPIKDASRWIALTQGAIKAETSLSVPMLRSIMGKKKK